MKYIDEYRSEQDAQRLLTRIEDVVTQPWTLMEICGGQTHTLMRSGIDRMLPEPITLVHGPGCPVCVTPVSLIDHAIEIARRPDTILASFGDMLRVPGSDCDLLSAKSGGADVRMMYSPLDAVSLAQRNPDRSVVFFAVGFETTAPANAMAVSRAATEGVSNFSVLVAHVLVPPALEALLGSDDVAIQGLLAPGHVCTVTGYRDYEPLSERHRVPIVVTGFEPLDLLKGVLAAVTQLERGEHRVENQYPRAVVRDGNPQAVRMIEEVFAVSDRSWRGVGEIPKSGYTLAPKYEHLDAERIFDVGGLQASEPEECQSGLVLQGRLRPTECPEFAARCTPEHPLGATMVSSEGACAAYFHYGRVRLEGAAAGKPAGG